MRSPFATKQIIVPNAFFNFFQASYGEAGLSYKFSGVTVPAVPWTATLLSLKRKVPMILYYCPIIGINSYSLITYLLLHMQPAGLR